eukprot:m.438592 g.438592  ORF g.438592 m.438592 type:complete len:240 (-) comp18261_c0_seq1:1690-2409(-)
MGSGGMMLQYTTPMEAFFALYIFAFSFIMMVGANPQYDYSFLQDYKVYLFCISMYLSPIQYWIVWNYPKHVMKWASKIGLNGVELCHYVVLIVKNLEYAAYLHFVDGGRLYDIYYKGYEHRKFDELVVFAIIAGQALVRAVYYRIGVDGVNYGAQMERPIPWVHGFPFNTGTRHPQYIGCVLAWISLFTITTRTEDLGKLVVASWAVLTSYWLSSEVEVEEPPSSPESPRVVKSVKKRS